MNIPWGLPLSLWGLSLSYCLCLQYGQKQFEAIPAMHVKFIKLMHLIKDVSFIMTLKYISQGHLKLSSALHVRFVFLL